MNSTNYNSLIKLASPQLDPDTYKLLSSLNPQAKTNAIKNELYTGVPMPPSRLALQQLSTINPMARTNAVGSGVPARDAEFYKSFTSSNLNRARTNAVGSGVPARDAEFYKSFTSLPESHLFTKLNPMSRNAINRLVAAGAPMAPSPLMLQPLAKPNFVTGAAR